MWLVIVAAAAAGPVRIEPADPVQGDPLHCTAPDATWTVDGREPPWFASVEGPRVGATRPGQTWTCRGSDGEASAVVGPEAHTDLAIWGRSLAALDSSGVVRIYGGGVPRRFTHPEQDGPWVALVEPSDQPCAIDSSGAILCDDRFQAQHAGRRFVSASASGQQVCGIDDRGDLWSIRAQPLAIQAHEAGPFVQGIPSWNRCSGLREGDAHTVQLDSADGRVCRLDPQGVVSGSSRSRGPYERAIAASATCCGQTAGGVECWDLPGLERWPGVRELEVLKSEACALDRDGQIACRPAPFDLPHPPMRPRSGPATADHGADHRCAIDGSGRLWCEGANQAGQIEPHGGAWQDVAVGPTHSCALDVEGRIACWGALASAPEGTFEAVAAGDRFACGLTGGALRCWGERQVADPGPWAAIDGERDVVCAAGETTRCWGLAGGPTGASLDVAVGGDWACAVLDSGALDCWGPDAPEPPAGDFTQVRASPTHACALGRDGSVACWGDDFWGQSRAPAGTFAAIEVGPGLSCATTADGLRECWGDDGTGRADLRATPTLSRIVVHRTHPVWAALDTQGRLQTWGRLDSSPRFRKAALARGRFRDLAFSDWVLWLVRDDGAIVAMGESYDTPRPQLDQPAESIRCGGQTCCARLRDRSTSCWGPVPIPDPASRYDEIGDSEGPKGAWEAACRLDDNGIATCTGRTPFRPAPGRPATGSAD